MSEGKDKYEMRRERERLEEEARLKEARMQALFVDSLTAFLEGRAYFELISGEIYFRKPS